MNDFWKALSSINSDWLSGGGSVLAAIVSVVSLLYARDAKVIARQQLKDAKPKLVLDSEIIGSSISWTGAGITVSKWTWSMNRHPAPPF